MSYSLPYTYSHIVKQLVTTDIHFTHKQNNRFTPVFSYEKKHIHKKNAA